VHVDHRGDGARDRELALARARVQLHVGARLDGELPHLPHRLGSERCLSPAGRS
jgi:hypothetical protein